MTLAASNTGGHVGQSGHAGRIGGRGRRSQGHARGATPSVQRAVQKSAGDATADGAGAFSFTITSGQRRPAIASTRRPLRRITSAEVTVGVRVRVGMKVSDKTLRRGRRVRFSGLVTPAHDGTAVKVQRKKRTGWRTLQDARARRGDTAQRGGTLQVLHAPPRAFDGPLPRGRGPHGRRLPARQEPAQAPAGRLTRESAGKPGAPEGGGAQDHLNRASGWPDSNRRNQRYYESDSAP